jgi:hypothetical protein
MSIQTSFYYAYRWLRECNGTNGIEGLQTVAKPRPSLYDEGD